MKVAPGYQVKVPHNDASELLKAAEKCRQRTIKYHGQRLYDELISYLFAHPGGLLSLERELSLAAETFPLRMTFLPDPQTLAVYAHYQGIPDLALFARTRGLYEFSYWDDTETPPDGFKKPPAVRWEVRRQTWERLFASRGVGLWWEVTEEDIVGWARKKFTFEDIRATLADNYPTTASDEDAARILASLGLGGALELGSV